MVGGRFVIERLIARGGMGAVYLAHQLNLGRPVALKIMTPPPDPEEGEGFEERFRLEAETLASLHHSNIVTVYDYGPTDDGRYYLALEYVEGPRFTDLIRKGRMDAERAVRLMLQVCDALHYAHRRGVVHRDLKPSNLLIRVEDGVETVKVVDFGLVKVMEAEQSLTRAGLVLGSPHCMAPEQVRGEDIDHRADIYAIGVLFFRALTGTWPFHGETVTSTMIAHVHDPVPTFHSVAPDLELPPGLEEMVRRCLAKAPAERFADVGDLVTALAGCVDVPRDQFHTVSSFHSRVPSDDRRRPARGVVVGIVAALIALVVVVGLIVARPWDGAEGQRTPARADGSIFAPTTSPGDPDAASGDAPASPASAGAAPTAGSARPVPPAEGRDPASATSASATASGGGAAGATAGDEPTSSAAVGSSSPAVVPIGGSAGGAPDSAAERGAAAAGDRVRGGGGARDPASSPPEAGTSTAPASTSPASGAQSSAAPSSAAPSSAEQSSAAPSSAPASAAPPDGDRSTAAGSGSGADAEGGAAPAVDTPTVGEETAAVDAPAEEEGTPDDADESGSDDKYMPLPDDL